MDGQKTLCDAHNILIENVRLVQESQEKLFNLDRGKASELSDIKIAVARLEMSTQAGFDSVAEQLESLRKLIAAQNSKHWKPGHLVALAGSFFGSAGIVIAAWITKGVKP